MDKNAYMGGVGHRGPHRHLAVCDWDDERVFPYAIGEADGIS